MWQRRPLYQELPQQERRQGPIVWLGSTLLWSSLWTKPILLRGNGRWKSPDLKPATGEEISHHGPAMVYSSIFRAASLPHWAPTIIHLWKTHGSHRTHGQHRLVGSKNPTPVCSLDRNSRSLQDRSPAGEVARPNLLGNHRSAPMMSCRIRPSTATIIVGRYCHHSPWWRWQAQRPAAADRHTSV